MTNSSCPRTMWAQDKHQVFVTFEVFEAKDVTVEFEKNMIRFSAVQSESNQKFDVELELFDEIKPEECTQFYTPREIKCTLEKANMGPFWPRLIKAMTKPHFIHVDFARWVDEDYEDEDPEAQAPIDPSAFMNLAKGTHFGDDLTGAYNPPSFADDSSDEGEDGEDDDEMPKLIED